MIEIRRLNVRYGTTQAVRGVDLDAAKGEVVAVVGPNGAGKTSTLRAVCGVERIHSGEVSVGGRPLVGLRPEQIVEAGVAMVPEGRRIFGELTVTENLQLARSSARARRTDVSPVDVLDLFPVLRRFAAKRAGLLSGGEQQQLAIARALLCHPSVLILDEPSFGLAPRVIDSVFETLAALKERGLTIIVVEQSVTRALNLADRAYVMSNGRIVTQGTKDELLAQPDFARSYLGISA